MSAATRRDTLAVAGRLTVWGAHDLHKLLNDHLHDDADVSVEFELHDEVDVAGLQLIVAAQKSAAARRNVSLELGPLPSSLISLAERLGMPAPAAHVRSNDV